MYDPMIPPQNLQQQYLGYFLAAGLPKDYLTASGRWTGDCVFMALPNQVEIFDDPAFQVLDAHSHREAGEHRISVVGNGGVVSVVAVATNGSELFIRLPSDGLGLWGTRTGTAETTWGYAIRVSTRRA